MTEPNARDVLNSLMDAHVDDPALKFSLGKLFLEVTVAVPSHGDPSVPGSFAPLVTDRGGHKCMVVITSPEGLSAVSPFARYAVEMSGSDVIHMIKPDLGLVLDNGSSSVVMTPEFVAFLKERAVS